MSLFGSVGAVTGGFLAHAVDKKRAGPKPRWIVLDIGKHENARTVISFRTGHTIPYSVVTFN